MTGHHVFGTVPAALLAMALAIACLGGPAAARGTDAASGGGWYDNGHYEFKFNFHAKTLPDGSARGERHHAGQGRR